MASKELLADEKISLEIRPSMLGEGSFWTGVFFMLFALILFVVMSIVAPNYDLSIAWFLSLFGLRSGPIGGGLPLVPIVMEVIGVVYIIYAQIIVFFKKYSVTNYRVISEYGVLSRDTDIIMPHEIGEVSVDRSVIDRVLGIGKVLIRLNDASRPEVRLIGIRDPYAFQNQVLMVINKKGDTENVSEQKTASTGTK